jgi:hypothetical protein
MVMALKILFVHGTGVRQPGYTDSFARARFMSRLLKREVQFEECYWGGTRGCQLNAQGASIPTYDSTRATDSKHVEPEDLEMGLWEMLYKDPLFECRVLRTSLPPTSFVAAHDDLGVFMRIAKGIDNDARTALAVLSDSAEGLSNEERAVAFSLLDEAMRWLAKQEEFVELLEAASDADHDIDDYADTAARATVARTIAVAEADIPAVTVARSAVVYANDSRLRDKVVEELAGYLGGSYRGFWGALVETATAPIKGLTLRGISWMGARHRGQLTDSTTFAAGDVLLYQARGDAIREFIRDRIQKTSAEVILAHSLGGIACVEVLIEQREPSVKLLVTAGSQSPFLFEIGALHCLPFDASKKPEERLPAGFPAWLNLYDTRDFLSFVGQGVFGNRVTDRPVNNRQPFPQSHSGYWTNPATWDAIRESLDKP